MAERLTYYQAEAMLRMLRRGRVQCLGGPWDVTERTARSLVRRGLARQWGGSYVLTARGGEVAVARFGRV